MQLRQLVCWLAATLCFPAAAAQYQVVTLDLPLAGYQSAAFDIDNHGRMIGTASGPVDSVGFIYSGGSFSTLAGPAGALGHSAFGASNLGVVVGSYYTTHVTDLDGNLLPGPQTGYILEGGVYTSFAAPAAAETYLRGISPGGRYLTGYALDAAGLFTAFVADRSSGSYRPITDGSLIAIAQGVNNAGVVVGNRYIEGPPLVRLAFIYDVGSGDLQTAQVAGARDTRYRAISETGIIAGFFSDTSGTHGLVGSANSFDTLDAAGSSATFVEGINEAGWLAGSYFDGAGISHAFVAVPVPEPAAWAMLLGGVALLAWRRRR